jgi:histidinol dehydrogenase
MLFRSDATRNKARFTMDIKRLNTQDENFWDELKGMLEWETVSDQQVFDTVNGILADVRSRGDAALIEYTNRFDRMDVESMEQLEVSQERLQQALENIPADQRLALETAETRIRVYAEHQKMESWQFTETDGTVLGQQVTPLDRVGLYVPGGKAAYPSSVLMNALPAKVAGVAELIMVVPTPDGEVNELVLAAAAVAGVDRVFTVGGAQAVAALAYGTETIPQVDKIVGPGNIYVATAKRMVFGTVGIDMIAGPSEILVLCDGKTDPDWIAMDLFSQAEHDEDAQAILVTTDAEFADKVLQSIDRLIEKMPRAEIIRESMAGRGIIIVADDIDDAVEVANYIAPEHLELSVDDAMEVSGSIRHAGAIFVGRYTSEALGDYCAGPNHVLPTSRTARFSSPLGVYDFQKRSSLIACSADAASRLGKTASVLARGEGLVAHARSAEYRIKD